MRYILLLILIDGVFCCTWPISDVLFILDSTVNVGPLNFQKQLNFVEKMSSRMRYGREATRIAISLFTPRCSNVFPLNDIQDNNENMNKILSVPYQPCDPTSRAANQKYATNNCEPFASINTIAQYALAEGNRKWIPDVIIVISTSRYRIQERLGNEVLMSPQSPIHLFYIVVGAPDTTSDRFEASATSIKLSAVDFDALQYLEAPLCNSVQNFVNRDASRPSVFGPLCWIVTVLLFIVFLIILCALMYALHVYREENKRLKHQIAETERNMRKQNEYFTAKIHKKMEEQLELTEKHREELKRQQDVLQAEHSKEREAAAASVLEAARHHQQQGQQQPQPIIIYGQPVLGTRVNPSTVIKAPVPTSPKRWRRETGQQTTRDGMREQTQTEVVKREPDKDNREEVPPEPQHRQ